MRMKREREKREKEMVLQRQHVEKVEAEFHKKKAAEDMIALLEREEKEMIERLKRTQSLQQDVSRISLLSSQALTCHSFIRHFKFCNEHWRHNDECTSMLSLLFVLYRVYNEGCFFKQLRHLL